MRSSSADHIHIWLGFAVLTLLTWPGPVMAQSGQPNRPPAAFPSRSPLPPLQAEPGDIWAEVRGWQTGPRRTLSSQAPAAGAAAAQPREDVPARSRPGRNRATSGHD